MDFTITLPNELAAQLQREASTRNLSMEDLVIEMLGAAFESDELFPTSEKVVAKIQALPANPHSIRPAVGSLAEALRTAPDDPDFDLETWKHEWAKVEAEMKTISRTNSLAEGLW